MGDQYRYFKLFQGGSNYIYDYLKPNYKTSFQFEQTNR